MTRYLFVYGSLRRNRIDAGHHPLLAACHYLSDAAMNGELYDVDGYPAAVPAESGFIKGELYLLDNPEQTLSALDVYEECAALFPAPHEYIRCRQTVILPNRRSLIAWTYLYNRPTDGLQRIPSGDYLHYLRENS